MIYYIINTQYMNKFFSESTCELLFSMSQQHTDTFPNRPPSSCVSLTLQYIKQGKKPPSSNLHFPFKKFLKSATEIGMYKDLLNIEI